MNLEDRRRMYGSDPLTRKALEHAERKKRLGTCDHRWPNRNLSEEPDHVRHKCDRVKGHENKQCRCPCGASTTIRRP